MKKHLIPAIIIDVGESLLAAKTQNEKNLLAERLETVIEYCQLVLNKTTGVPPHRK